MFKGTRIFLYLSKVKDEKNAINLMVVETEILEAKKKKKKAHKAICYEFLNKEKTSLKNISQQRNQDDKVKRNGRRNKIRIGLPRALEVSYKQTWVDPKYFIKGPIYKLK